MKNPRLLSVVILLALVGLLPLAYANPPDPVWISGFFDDTDREDASVLVLRLKSPQKPTPLLIIVRFLVIVQMPLVGVLPLDSPALLALQVRPLRQTRAPPIA